MEQLLLLLLLHQVGGSLKTRRRLSSLDAVARLQRASSNAYLFETVCSAIKDGGGRRREALLLLQEQPASFILDLLLGAGSPETWPGCVA